MIISRENLLQSLKKIKDFGRQGPNWEAYTTPFPRLSDLCNTRGRKILRARGGHTTRTAYIRSSELQARKKSQHSLGKVGPEFQP